MQNIRHQVLLEGTVTGFNELLVRVLTEQIKKAFDNDELFTEKNRRLSDNVQVAIGYAFALDLLSEQVKYDGVVHKRVDVLVILAKAQGIIDILNQYLPAQEPLASEEPTPVVETAVSEPEVATEPAPEVQGGCPICGKNGNNWEAKDYECHSCGIQGREEFELYANMA